MQLYPFNTDPFVKYINLMNNQRVKIGRQTNARTVPAEIVLIGDKETNEHQKAERKLVGDGNGSSVLASSICYVCCP
jgi:hypothetical protein